MLSGTMIFSILYGLVFDKVSYLVTTPCFLVAMMLLGGGAQMVRPFCAWPSAIPWRRTIFSERSSWSP